MKETEEEKAIKEKELDSQKVITLKMIILINIWTLLRFEC